MTRFRTIVVVFVVATTFCSIVFSQANNDQSVFESLASKARDGDAEAQYELGRSYLYGLGASKNPKLAVSWFRKAADQGHPGGQNGLGVCLQAGSGVEQDYLESLKWIRKAADQGLAKAEHNIGIAYRDGLGVDKNMSIARSWFEKAANESGTRETGFAASQYTLGEFYRQGISTEQDYKRAMEWYLKAAQQGHTNAQFSVGYYGYLLGKGVETNVKLAMEWMEKAAAKNSTNAKNVAYKTYLKHRELFQDAEGKAAVHLKDLASKGFMEAQFFLGLLYEEGKGVEQDDFQAAKWYLRAAKQDYRGALARLARIAPNRSTIANHFVLMSSVIGFDSSGNFNSLYLVTKKRFNKYRVWDIGSPLNWDIDAVVNRGIEISKNRNLPAPDEIRVSPSYTRMMLETNKQSSIPNGYWLVSFYHDKKRILTLDMLGEPIDPILLKGDNAIDTYKDGGFEQFTEAYPGPSVGKQEIMRAARQKQNESEYKIDSMSENVGKLQENSVTFLSYNSKSDEPSNTLFQVPNKRFGTYKKWNTENIVNWDISAAANNAIVIAKKRGKRQPDSFWIKQSITKTLVVNGKRKWIPNGYWYIQLYSNNSGGLVVDTLGDPIHPVTLVGKDAIDVFQPGGYARFIKKYPGPDLKK